MSALVRPVLPQGRDVRCMATVSGEETTPLFVGREDGTIEKYVSIADADLGQPTLILRGHKRAVTALVATSADELYSCSLDGTIKVWNADRDLEIGAQRVVRNIDLHTPLHCLALDEGRVYAGGQDGALKVIDGKRQSSWPGHDDILSCIAFSASGLAVTGSYDRHIRVWDLSSGKCIRILSGHTNVVKAVAVVDPDEENGGDGEDAPRAAIVSFGLDRRLLVWRCPQMDGLDAEDAAALQAHTDLAFLDRYVGSWHRPELAKHFPGLVPEPTIGATSGPFQSGEDDDENEDGDRNEADGEEDPGEEGRAGVSGASGGDAGADGVDEEEARGDGAHGFVSSKFAKVAVDAPIATVELLEDPYVVDKKGEGFVYLGGTNGSVLGLKLRTLMLKCFSDLDQRQQAVLAAFREARLSFKQARTFYEKKYRKENQMEWRRLLRMATRKRNAEKKAEKEALDKTRAEQRAAAAAARAAAATDDDEEYEGDEEYAEEDEVYEDAEEGEEEDEEDEETSAHKQQEMVWHYLGEEEKARYEKLVSENECQPVVLLKERSALLRQRLEATLPLLHRPYTRSADQFAKLSWVTTAKAGAECVLAIVHDEERQKVYASQDARVVPVNITVGVHAL